MSHKGARIRNRKLRKLYEETKHNYYAGAYFDEDRGVFKRYTSNIRKDKLCCRRAMRRRLNRDPDNYTRGNRYKLCYDYKWTVT